MSDLQCPFSAPLLAKIYACQYCSVVIRRGGSEIACSHQEKNLSCQQLAELLQKELLLMLGYENDLLKTPHSMLQKIQIGGLAGLYKYQYQTDQVTIDSIETLVKTVIDADPKLSQIPIKSFVTDVKQVKLKRRHKKNN